MMAPAAMLAAAAVMITRFRGKSRDRGLTTSVMMSNAVVTCEKKAKINKLLKIRKQMYP